MSDVQVVGPDPGPLARFEALKSQPEVAQQVFLRLCDGDSLRSIARAWGCPKGLFVLWFMSEHGKLFDDAEKVRAQDLKHEALAIADEQKAAQRPDGSEFDPEVPRDKLRVDTRLKILEKLDRERFGKFTKHEHTHTIDLGERLRRARERELEQVEVQALPESVVVAEAI